MSYGNLLHQSFKEIKRVLFCVLLSECLPFLLVLLLCVCDLSHKMKSMFEEQFVNGCEAFSSKNCPLGAVVHLGPCSELALLFRSADGRA